jgi:hypothetical protein
VIGEKRWRDNWRVVSPDGSRRVDLPRGRRERRGQSHAIRELPAGTPVVLFAKAPGAIGRCRSFASEAGIEVEREYLAFPNAATPGYLVEDAPASVGLFVERFLTSPPRSRFSRPLEAGFGLLRRLDSWRLIRTIAPARVAVGRRR